MYTIRTAVFLIALSVSYGCASVAPDGLKCAGKPTETIKIKYKRHSSISTDDPEVWVQAGHAINYKVQGPKSRAFKAKGTKGPGSASYGWLDATGSGEPGGKSHILCVPAGQARGTYEYLIEIDGVGTLDPTVHVD